LEDYVGRRLRSGDALVNALQVDIEAQSRRGVGLRIGVQQENFLAQQRERRREVDGRGRLAHAAFLIGQCDDLCHVC